MSARPSLSKNAAATTPPATGSEQTAAHVARRRFIKIGLATAPVVMTLASRPALANGVGPSIGLSGNVSTFGKTPPKSGCSTNYWKSSSHKDNWYSPCFYGYPDSSGGGYHGGTMFGAYFYNSFPNKTMLQVVSDTTNGAAAVLGREATAAYLNSLYFGNKYRFSSDMVIKLYNDAVLNGGATYHYNISALTTLFHNENAMSGT